MSPVAVQIKIITAESRGLPASSPSKTGMANGYIIIRTPAQ